MDLMYENYEMIYFSGRHAMERTAERIPVQHAKVEIGRDVYKRQGKVKHSRCGAEGKPSLKRA